jgi:hypothetical protein
MPEIAPLVMTPDLESQPDLAHDLGPQLERVTRVLPIRERKRGPFTPDLGLGTARHHGLTIGETMFLTLRISFYRSKLWESNIHGSFRACYNSILGRAPRRTLWPSCVQYSAS